MAKRRLSYTYSEAHTTLTAWIEKRRMSQKAFAEFLTSRGIDVSPQTCSALVHGRITPGPKFKAVFRELTGVELEDGLIERERRVS